MIWHYFLFPDFFLHGCYRLLSSDVCSRPTRQVNHQMFRWSVAFQQDDSAPYMLWVLWNFFQESFPGAVRHWHGHRSNHLLGDLLGHLTHRQLDLWQWKLRWAFVEQHPCRLHSCSFRRLLPVWLWADEVHPPWWAVWATGAGGWNIFLKEV